MLSDCYEDGVKLNRVKFETLHIFAKYCLKGVLFFYITVDVIQSKAIITTLTFESIKYIIIKKKYRQFELLFQIILIKCVQ